MWVCVGAAWWDGLAGLEWLAPLVGFWVGIGDGPPEVPVWPAVVGSTYGFGDGSARGRAVWPGSLLPTLAVGLNGRSVPVQLARPQPPRPGRSEWPGEITTAPVNAATPAPIPKRARHGCLPSMAGHRRRLVA